MAVELLVKCQRCRFCVVVDWWQYVFNTSYIHTLTCNLKKQSPEQRRADVKKGFRARKKPKTRKIKNHVAIQRNVLVQDDQRFIRSCEKLVHMEIDSSNKVVLHLPLKLNFTHNHKSTIANLMAIRRLVRRSCLGGNRLRLKRVAFERLKEISTTAALVLTAELAKWEDASNFNLTADVNLWKDDIFRQFSELGYFDLFSNPPSKKIVPADENDGPHLVRYIKGRFREHDKPRLLQRRLKEIVGDEIDEWSFLHTGIVEAIINVTHHAYPDDKGYGDIDKNWYLTGSYNKATRQLKIVFYDQGITIPGSLPASDWGEKILNYLSGLGILEGKNDSHLISAAMEMSRSRTNEDDRGKGLQDILQFVKQRKDGYLAVVSRRGIFRLVVNETSEQTSTTRLSKALEGTLIVWSVTLEQSGV